MARFSKRSLFLSPGRQRKFAKPELAYGLAKGGQTDLQVERQVQNLRRLASPFGQGLTCTLGLTND